MQRAILIKETAVAISHMGYATQFLNKIVDVMVDRPLGSKHPKFGDIYPLNYGYIEGFKAPDGEYVDAYILGVNKPLTRYRGRCIAIIHRLDDEDDKLVVCRDGKDFSDEEIRKQTSFQEKYFKSIILRN